MMSRGRCSSWRVTCRSSSPARTCRSMAVTRCCSGRAGGDGVFLHWRRWGPSMTAKLLVIDNYDSFTFNLVQMFRAYDLEISVFRADALSVEEVLQRRPDYVLVSPGPKAPRDAGISTELIRRCEGQFPLLGVCLGMQCMNEAFGGTTVHAPVP